VQQLAKLLDSKKVVHVRGTPAYGKPTLAFLLKRNYRQKDIRVVYMPIWPKTGEKVDGEEVTCMSHLLSYVRLAGYDLSSDDLFNARIVLMQVTSSAIHFLVIHFLAFLRPYRQVYNSNVFLTIVPFQQECKCMWIFRMLVSL
jgi:hypothetical protein